jgi:hypothetical protein
MSGKAHRRQQMSNDLFPSSYPSPRGKLIIPLCVEYSLNIDLMICPDLEISVKIRVEGL